MRNPVIPVRAALFSISSLLIGVGLLQVGTGQFTTFLSMRMEVESFSTISIGLVGSAYFAGFILGTFRAVQLVERVGHIRAFSALAAGLSAVSLLHPLWIGTASWIVFRLIAGFCISGLFIIAESWINERATRETRGQILSIYMIVTYLTLGCGQFLVGAAPVNSMTPFLIASCLFSLSLLPVALTRATSPPAIQIKRFGFGKLFRVSPFGVAGCAGVGMINGAFYALAPVFSGASGLNSHEIARFMAVAILSGLCLQWPLGRLSDLFDRRILLLLLFLAVAVVAIGFWQLADLSTVKLLWCAGVYGAVAFTIYPVAVANANDHIDSTDCVAVSAGLILAYGLGAALGPVAASSVMSVSGPPGLFLFIAAVSGALVVFGIVRLFQRPAVAADRKEPFVAVPRTSPVVQRLDPRAMEKPADPV